ncbi:MAG: hypothetical protein IT463_05985 [Planctomycetes bacterium]|nr:hypothetical protein [Planctomycetota bacterium]
MRLVLLAAMAALLAPLAAQNRTRLEVSFPSTTTVYVEARLSELKGFGLTEMGEAISKEIDLPDLGKLVEQSLALKLSDAEVRALASGTRTVAVGVLDITLKGPKFQIVIEHENLKALDASLAKGLKEGIDTLAGAEDYDGTPIYELALSLGETTADDEWGGLRMDSKVRSWLAEQQFYLAIYQQHYLVLASTSGAVKDALDGLAFPDDPAETLLGNKRYLEAIAQYKDPVGLVFVNIQTLITIMERLGGDKGSTLTMIWAEIMRGDPEQARFIGELLQYQQFKSFAGAVFPIDYSGGGGGAVRMDARLTFHNAPGWFEALRTPPAKPLFTDMLPPDALSVSSLSLQDPAAFYNRVRGFFVGRAKEAGQADLVTAMENGEAEAGVEAEFMNRLLSHVQGGLSVAVVAPELPGGAERRRRRDYDPVTAMLIGIKDVRSAERFLFDELLETRLGDSLKEFLNARTRVVVEGGVEINISEDGKNAHAFVPTEGAAGVLVCGQAQAVRRILAARASGDVLAKDKVYQQTQGMIWEQSVSWQFLHLGRVLSLALAAETRPRGGSENVPSQEQPRDDTEDDHNALRRLEALLRDTVLISAARSEETIYEMRVVATGWPTGAGVQEVARQFRDAGRNQEVSADLHEVRNAAATYVAMKGAAPKAVGDLEKAGYLRRHEHAVDPYGNDDSAERLYVLAAQTAKPDIRQGILLAYQEKPGLDGRHVVVLWNDHVLTLEPGQLQDAIARAAEGRAVDDAVYRDELPPLHTRVTSRNRDMAEVPEPVRIVQVKVIDDDGNESEILVPEDRVMAATEEHLDAAEEASKDE